MCSAANSLATQTQQSTKHIKNAAPDRNTKWYMSGLNTSTDNLILGGDIVAYRIKWFNGKWSAWYVPGVNDIDPKLNTTKDNTLAPRRMWSYFSDHTHEYIILTNLASDLNIPEAKAEPAKEDAKRKEMNMDIPRPQ